MKQLNPTTAAPEEVAAAKLQQKPGELGTPEQPVSSSSEKTDIAVEEHQNTNSNGMDSSSECLTGTDSNRADQQVPLHQPKWEIWKTRPTISVYGAVCLLHNVRPSRKYVKLLDKDDPRRKNFNVDLITLKRWIPVDPLFKSALKKDTAPTYRTQIRIQQFVQFVSGADVFKKENAPQELLNLQRHHVPTPKATARPSQAKTFDVPINPIRASTMARMLVALAIGHHHFQPGPAVTQDKKTKTEGGTYTPIFKLCERMKFKRPGEWETVRDVLREACNLIGLDEVNLAIELQRDWLAKQNR
jgi:hypothetical protein